MQRVTHRSVLAQDAAIAMVAGSYETYTLALTRVQLYGCGMGFICGFLARDRSAV